MHKQLTIAAFSDTHGNWKDVKIPSADVAICCGDFADTVKLNKGLAFIDWYAQQPTDVKILIGGNHDNVCEKYPDEFKSACQKNRIHYLENSGVRYKGIHFWGFPYAHYNIVGSAFEVPDDEQLRPLMNKIPDTVDVFISHVPPYGILDDGEDGKKFGSHAVLEKVNQLRPKYHFFGHAHGQFGATELNGINFINVSITNNQLEIVENVQLLSI